jgi:hypothetical protein
MKTFEPEKVLSKVLDKNLKISFHDQFIENKSVLGIDIYKYSEYPADMQVYVPVLFNSLYQLTVTYCCQYEKYFFQNYGSSLSFFKEHFISTGDGGFQIFDNPIQSIVFSAYYQLNVRRFNSGSLITVLNKNLFEIIGRIELRYAITFDKIYAYDKNFYGPAIINNARILSKDHLNRFLIDFQSSDWFDKNNNTLENLLIMKKEDFCKTKYFKNYNKDESTLLFNIRSNIKSIDILKIGTIKSKNTSLEIFNLRIQILINLTGPKGGLTEFLVTIGNLNTQGIE